MAKKKQSRDQQRKAKLKARDKRRPPAIDLSYEGDQYRTDELLPLVAAAESAINEADVRGHGKLLDRYVKAAFDYLILGMRDDTLPPFEEWEQIRYRNGQERELLVYLIRRNWEDLFEEWDEPTLDEKVGVLRTLLGSIKTFGSGTRHSRGYVAFVNDFQEKQGMDFVLDEDEDDFDEDDEDVELEEEEEDDDDAEDVDPLQEAGEAWVLSEDLYAENEFKRIAQTLITAGQKQHVAKVAQSLSSRAIGEIKRELLRIATEAKK